MGAYCRLVRMGPRTVWKIGMTVSPHNGCHCHEASTAEGLSDVDSLLGCVNRTEQYEKQMGSKERARCGSCADQF